MMRLKKRENFNNELLKKDFIYKALNLAALIHVGNNRLEYASNCFEEALKTKPNDNEVLFNYGQHCLKLENLNRH